MTLDQFAGEIRNLGVDVRLEVILAELYAGGLDPRADLMIHSKGLFARSYRRDVGEVRVGVAHLTDGAVEPLEKGEQRDYLHIDAHRDGLYDYLPEGLFHQPSRVARDEKEQFAEIDEQALRAKGARRFFQPIEQGFYLSRLLLELEERKYLLTEENLRQNEQGAVLREFWGLPTDLLDIRQLNNLLHLLPVAHRLVNDRALVTQVFALILGVSVQIRTIPPLTFPIRLSDDDAPAPNELSRAQLGSFSLDGDYQDTMPATEVRIGPLNDGQLTSFLEGGRNRAILDLLIHYFMPVESEVIDHLITDEANQFLVLANGNPTSVLGVASYI
jgi:hypothetical protein